MPAPSAKFSGHALIALLIVGDFVLPSGNISFRSQISLAVVAVPKAAIHEDGESCDGKNEIRFAE
jgi:hypothetical protein